MVSMRRNDYDLPGEPISERVLRNKYYGRRCTPFYSFISLLDSASLLFKWTRVVEKSLNISMLINLQRISLPFPKESHTLQEGICKYCSKINI